MSKAEKFISDYTRKCSNECCGEGINVGHGVTLSKRCYTPWLTPDQARMAVEIEREETIEKACNIIRHKYGHHHYLFGDITEDLIREFRKAMKDE